MTIKRLLILVLLLAISSSLQAQRFNTKQINAGERDGQWEAALLVNYQNGTDFAGENGSSIDIDKAWGWGVTFAYNLTSNWHFNFRLGMNEPDYSALIVIDDPEIPPQTINYTMSKYSGQLNAVYNFFEGPVTPFVQGGLGWTRLDSNIVSKPPSTGCWWDPWWGYICATSWSTFETTEFTYNLGLGMRWDINPALFTRGTITREWISVDSGTLEFDTLNLELGLLW